MKINYGRHETKPFPHLHGYQTLTNQRHKHQQQSNYYNDIERFDNFITGMGILLSEGKL